MSDDPPPGFEDKEWYREWLDSIQQRVLFYKLVNREPVACADVLEWGRYMEETDRFVAGSIIAGVKISTAFIGVDMSILSEGPPLLFETMTFDEESGLEITRRCATWAEAEAQHEVVVALVKRRRLQ